MFKLAGAVALPVLALGLIGAGTPSLSASGFQVVAVGNTEARACSDNARLAADGKMSPAFAIETCSEALNIESLSAHDLAATHNNRGVLYLSMNGAAAARTDFEAASRVEPKLAEAWINYGVSQVKMGQDRDAVADFDRGLSLGTAEPWKAYFNRGVARENLGDVKGAYEDYRQAQALKPDWDAPRTELARFTVQK